MSVAAPYYLCGPAAGVRLTTWNSVKFALPAGTTVASDACNSSVQAVCVRRVVRCVSSIVFLNVRF